MMRCTQPEVVVPEHLVLPVGIIPTGIVCAQAHTQPYIRETRVDVRVLASLPFCASARLVRPHFPTIICQSPVLTHQPIRLTYTRVIYDP